MIQRFGSSYCEDRKLIPGASQLLPNFDLLRETDSVVLQFLSILSAGYMVGRQGFEPWTR